MPPSLRSAPNSERSLHERVRTEAHDPRRVGRIVAVGGPRGENRSVDLQQAGPFLYCFGSKMTFPPELLSPVPGYVAVMV